MRVTAMLSLVLFGILLGWNPSTLAQGAPPWHWKFLDTPHFRVLFHPGVENLAQEAAVAAEDAYTLWSKELKTSISGKVSLVVIDNDDSPNGFSDTFDLTTWEFAAQVQFGSLFGGQVASNMGDTIYHEFWHMIDLGKVSGISQYLRLLFGRVILPSDTKPGFAFEGSAVYAEFMKYGYSRANFPWSAMYLRQMALDNNFPPLDRLGERFSTTNYPGFGVSWYLVGSWFMRYLEETYGKGTMGKIDNVLGNSLIASLSNILGDLLGDNFGASLYLSPDFGATLQQATGVPVKKLYPDFQAWLRKQFSEQIAQAQKESLTTSWKLSPLTHYNAQPSWSPKGDWLAYEHGDSWRTAGLRLIKPTGESDHALFSSSTIFDEAYAWSPDGTKIVYSGYDTYNYFLSQNDLYLYDLKTGSTRRLTHGQRAYNPVFTPDGKKIIFGRQRVKHDADHSPDLASLDLETHKISVIKEFPEDTFVDYFALSPGGKTLALSIWKRPGYSDIYTMPAEGGELTPLTQDKAEDSHPSWSPDGQYILFDSMREPIINVYALKIADDTLHKVTNVISAAYNPQVSPDGKQLAFVSYGNQGFSIQLMDYDPSQWKSVNLTKETIPAWEGYPKTEYKAYDYFPFATLATLLPKYWEPVVSTNASEFLSKLVFEQKLDKFTVSEIGITTGATDALYQRNYTLRAGWNLERKAPFYDFNYSTEGLLPPLTFTLDVGQDPDGNYQSLDISYPLLALNNHSHTLSFNLTQAYYGKTLTHTLAVTTDFFYFKGLDLMANTLRATLDADITHTMGDDKTLPKEAVLNVRDTIRLPIIDSKGTHSLALRAVYGWSDSESNFGLGGDRGRFMLRGFKRGAMAGKQIISATAEYRFPVWAIEHGLGLWPVFIDNVNGAVFFDAGTASDEKLDPSQIKMSFGAELYIQLLTGYGSSTVFRFGIAQGMGAEKPVLYFRFGTPF
ncbi:PD40 domain-containing protein [Candidatus Acetothermia bacterium]|nr:PD40 domain-containing protein [Candidatus Acetothermia bacterium]MBI3659854.1 PD40 domain-containing protein [Candidatus Acetothermia bacterium]